MKPTNEIRPIDANSLIATLNDDIEALRAFYVALYCTASTLEAVKKDVESTPTLDVAPVIHAQWITAPSGLWDEDNIYKCSACGEEFVLYNGTPEDNQYKYCPHCGAKMDNPPTD